MIPWSVEDLIARFGFPPNLSLEQETIHQEIYQDFHNRFFHC